MLLYRIGPEGFYAVGDEPDGDRRLLPGDPLAEPVERWKLGRRVARQGAALLAPMLPGKIAGIGRNYVEPAREVESSVPSAPRSPVVLPLESQRVEYEGEIAVVVRERLRRATAEEAVRGVLGVTCACDVTARDLQRKDATFARAKSFDTFCPLGPGILAGAGLDLGDLTVGTRLNGEERQRGSTHAMVFGIVDLLVYASRMMTLEPGDVLLTGTPGGVGQLAGGDLIEVEVFGVGVLANPVETWKQAP